MNILYFYNMLRMNGINFLRARYFVEDLEKRGHNVRLAYFIVDDKNKLNKELQDDAISFKEVSEFCPDALFFELGSADRFPSRKYLNKLKLQGCIIVHCGLDYNEYNCNREKYDKMYEGFGCGIRKKKRDDMYELPDIRFSDMVSQITRTDVEILKNYCSISESKIFENVPWVSSMHALVISPFNHILLTSGPNSFIKAYNDDIHGENYAIYGAFSDIKGIEILITGHFVTDCKERVKMENNRTFLINVLEYFHLVNPSKYKLKLEQVVNTADGLNIESTMKWDIFISHASEDKKEIAKSLADALTKKNMKVWYDEFTLTLGDSLRRSIDKGLANSKYGVVIISKNFFNKDWPKKELDGLMALEVNNRKVILPVWHQITKEEILKYSPMLADRLGIKTNQGINKVVEAIIEAM